MCRSFSWNLSQLNYYTKKKSRTNRETGTTGGDDIFFYRVMSFFNFNVIIITVVINIFD